MIFIENESATFIVGLSSYSTDKDRMLENESENYDRFKFEKNDIIVNSVWSNGEEFYVELDDESVLCLGYLGLNENGSFELSYDVVQKSDRDAYFDFENNDAMFVPNCS